MTSLGTARVRSRSSGYTGGTGKYCGLGSTVTSPYQPEGWSETCEDVIGNYGGNNFFLKELTTFKSDVSTGSQTANCGLLPRCTSYAGQPCRIHDGYPIGVETWKEPPHLTLADPGVNVHATKLLALTNPSRPVVDLPVALLELRDLPRLFKIESGNLARKAAGGNLSYQFGWKPFISDLRKLLDFQNTVAKVERRLRSLYSKGGIHARRDLWTGNGTGTSNDVIVFSLSGELWKAKLERLTVRDVWGTVRWTPTSLPPTTDDGFRKLARKVAFGLAITPATLYQAMPWRWLIDWFSNLGDFLEAHRNTVPAVPTHICVMTRTRTYRWQTITSGRPSWAAGGDAYYTRTTKRRDPVTSVLPQAYLPFLGIRQVSILGSLAILGRFRPR
ncbi:MAG: putative maturation protein [Shiltuvirus faecivicinum]|uniref:Maturation protein n=1 Tax=Leviviridae sp. TaxID=2027243 RepID=A0ABY3SSI0_9VIRU|nr:MAG: putative maturation protein [Leviviridae sp.]